MSKRGRRIDPEETGIRNLVIVNCHGVTKSSRKTPYDNSVTVEYPTILTAHLGTQTFLPADVTDPAKNICKILTNHIYKALTPSGIEIISLGEIVRTLKTQAVDTGTGTFTVFAEKTPIKPKLPGDSFQNIELFCEGIRKDSGPGRERVPVGNTDGVWVCKLVDPYSCKNVTSSMFKNGLTNGENDVVNENDYVYDEVKKRYIITRPSWLNRNGSKVTYPDLIERLKERKDLPIETTAILIIACRVFDDDDDEDDRVESNRAIYREMQELLARQEYIKRRRTEILLLNQQKHQQQHDASGGGSSKQNAKIKIGRGGSNKKRRYTNRKKYFKSSRKVNKLKIKKRRTRKYKNKK